MNTKWRPMMGWMYMVVCICDFVLFPVLWSLVQAVHGGQVATQWSPITLNGAGLFHMAMGAILGIAVYGRTQEKLNGANNSNTQLPTPSMNPITTTTFSGGVSQQPLTSSTGKLMPAQPAQPEL